MANSIAHGHPTSILNDRITQLDHEQMMVAVRAVERHVAPERQDEMLRMLGARS